MKYCRDDLTYNTTLVPYESRVLRVLRVFLLNLSCALRVLMLLLPHALSCLVPLVLLVLELL